MKGEELNLDFLAPDCPVKVGASSRKRSDWQDAIAFVLVMLVLFLVLVLAMCLNVTGFWVIYDLIQRRGG